MSAAASLFAAEGICKSFFGVQVLHDVALSLRPGEVLGLVGENGSGKSTTMNIVGGVLQPDRGRMTFQGQPYRPRNPRDAELAGIATVHQELNLFRNLTVAENLFIAGFPRRFGMLPLIDKRAMARRTAELLGAVDLSLPPETPLARLSAGERQLVEIAKAIGAKARLIIFDEPTTSLTARETARLFDIIGRLRAQGIAMIYISHILSDVLRLTDTVMVLRDGHVVGGGPTAEITQPRMISLMVGRALNQLFPDRAPALRAGAPALEARGITQRGMVRDVSFAVQPGEVLGLSGLMGAGRSELARILFGLDPFEAGEVFVNGQRLSAPSPAACMQAGMAFLTEDRRAEGLMMEASIADNIGLAALPSYASAPFGFLQRTRLGTEVRDTSRAVQMAAGRDPFRTLVKQLSGGNQQKAVIGKWLLAKPRAFILDEPTRGIDVGAKYEVYKIINHLAAEGAGVLFISSEIEELAGMCDRILVMAHGEIRAAFARNRDGGPAFDPEAILRAAMWDGAAPAARAA